MKNKIIILIAFLFSLIFISNASAFLLSNAAWDDNSNEKTIEFGEEATFYIRSRTDNVPFSVNIKIYDSNNRLIHYLGDFENSEEYEKNFVVSQNDYVNSGTYRINIEIRDSNVNEPADIFNLILNINRPQNTAPTISLLLPANEANNIPLSTLLRWDGNDIDNDNLFYDVYLNNRLIASELRQEQYPVNLQYNTNYQWHVIVSDGINNPVQSSIWNFRTILRPQENQAPIVDITSPRFYEIIEGIHNIEWNANDVDGSIVNTKVYYRRHSNIPLFDWLRGYRLLVELPGNIENGNYLFDTTRLRNGRYTLLIIVKDDDNSEGEDVNDFRILNAFDDNNAPQITSNPITNAFVDTLYKYDVEGRDIDNDIITYSLRNYPNGMIINPTTGVINWFPRNTGIYEIIVEARDENGASDLQIFNINVQLKQNNLAEIHKFSISNVIINQDNQYLNVYVKLENDGDFKEKIQLRAVNVNTGELTYDSFLLETGDGYWRILKLPKPSFSGVYTIGVWGNSKNYKDIIYRDVVIN